MQWRNQNGERDGLLMEAKDQGLLVDTPFLRRVREKGRAEELAEGQEKLAQAVIALRQSVLDTWTLRFNPPVIQFRSVEAQLETINDPERLHALLQAALRAADMAEFEQALKGE